MSATTPAQSQEMSDWQPRSGGALVSAVLLSLLLASMGSAQPGRTAGTAQLVRAVQLKAAAQADVQKGRYADGIANAREALALREQALGPDHPEVAEVLVLLGRALGQLGRYDESRRELERAREIQERGLGPAHPQLALTLLELGVLRSRLGDNAGARALYDRAIRIREAAFGPTDLVLAACLDADASALLALGDDAGAEAAISRSLAIREQALGENHPAVAAAVLARGRIQLQMRRYPEARADLERALRIFERTGGSTHPEVGLTLNALAHLYLQTREPASAQAALERAVGILRQGGFPEVYWRSAWQLGRLYERQGRWPAAVGAYREAATEIRALAVSLGERGTRAQYLESQTRLEVFDALVRVLLQLNEREPGRGYDAEAWATIEAKKGLLAADALSAARPAIQNPLAKQAADAVEATRSRTAQLQRALSDDRETEGGAESDERIQTLAAQLAQTKAEYLAQVQTFLSRYPQYRAQFVDQQTVDPKALAKFADRLPAETLAVQYFAAPDALYLFIVAPGGRFTVKREAVPQKDLYDLVKAYRAGVARAAVQRLPWPDDGSEAYRQDVAPLRETTERLSGRLLGPIAAELRAYPNLVLFPNDLLLYLPIHALTWTPQPGGPVRFLAETHVVSYVTQLELVDLLNPIPAQPGEPVLALSNPDGTLPAASREVREVARIRQGVTALDGAEATKARFESLAPKFPELHLATHGVLDPERPDRSYLLVAGDDEANQHLTIADIAGLSLAPHALAILSGCETAVGEQVPGAALVTLAAAFSQAGSQSIVASLWKVSDAATRDFMIAFHKALMSKSRAEALREAELAVLRNPATAHPFYWAPFVLIGGR